MGLRTLLHCFVVETFKRKKRARSNSLQVCGSAPRELSLKEGFCKSAPVSSEEVLCSRF